MRLRSQIAADDFLRLIHGLERHARRVCRELALDALHVVEVEDVVELQDGHEVLLEDGHGHGVALLRLLLLLLHHGGGVEADDAALSTLLERAAEALDLLEGQPLPGLAQQQLVEHAVGLAGDVVNSTVHGAVPRASPRDKPLLHLLDNLVGYHLVNVESLFLAALGGLCFLCCHNF